MATIHFSLDPTLPGSRLSDSRRNCQPKRSDCRSPPSNFALACWTIVRYILNSQYICFNYTSTSSPRKSSSKQRVFFFLSAFRSVSLGSWRIRMTDGTWWGSGVSRDFPLGTPAGSLKFRLLFVSLHYFAFFQIFLGLMADQKEPLKRQTSATQRIRHASLHFWVTSFFFVFNHIDIEKGLDCVAHDSSTVSQTTNNRQITMEGFRSFGIMVSV